MKLLHLNFIPRSADLALLALRLWYGLPLLLLHGWGKLTGFSAMAEKFPDPLNVGHSISLGLAVFAEVVCGACIALGLFTRLAALIAMIELGVAFWFVHGHRLTGSGNGELAYLYVGGYLALLIAGGGKYSVDAGIGAKG